jgi:23S rRNA maturation mini-RNase III
MEDKKWNTENCCGNVNEINGDTLEYFRVVWLFYYLLLIRLRSLFHIESLTGLGNRVDTMQEQIYRSETAAVSIQKQQEQQQSITNQMLRNTQQRHVQRASHSNQLQQLHQSKIITPTKPTQYELLAGILSLYQINYSWESILTHVVLIIHCSSEGSFLSGWRSIQIQVCTRFLPSTNVV